MCTVCAGFVRHTNAGAARSNEYTKLDWTRHECSFHRESTRQSWDADTAQDQPRGLPSHLDLPRMTSNGYCVATEAPLALSDDNLAKTSNIICKLPIALQFVTDRLLSRAHMLMRASSTLVNSSDCRVKTTRQTPHWLSTRQY